MRIYTLSFVCLVILCFSSCRKDAVIDMKTTEKIDQIFITGDVNGLVIDNEGLPVPDATVRLGVEVSTTDENGIFRFSDVQLANLGSYVSVEKNGYFHSGKNIFASEAADYRSQIVLTPYKETTSFSSMNGVEFLMNEGAKINIPSSGLALDGQAYVGEVSLFAAWLDPSDAESFETMPGDLTGSKAEDDTPFDDPIYSLSTFGMLAVDMFTPAGERLQIAEDSEATVTFPIPTSLDNIAEDEIDLWHFDEVQGIWILEGTATKVGTNYEATVTHFSWWNCDVASSTGTLCVNFLNRDGSPFNVSNVSLQLSSGQFGTASSFLNNQAVFCGLIPLGFDMELSLVNSCGETLYTETIGPFTETTNSIEIQLNNDLLNIKTIVGTLFDCNNDPVSNGYVKIESQQLNSIVFVESDGSYRISYVKCESSSNELELVGADFDNNQQNSETIILVDGQDFYNVNFQACGNVVVLDPIFTYFDTVTTLSSSTCDARVTAAETLILSDIGLLGINGFGVGSFTGNFLKEGADMPTELGETNIEISSFGDVGENIIGSYANSDGTGNFIALRIQ